MLVYKFVHKSKVRLEMCLHTHGVVSIAQENRGFRRLWPEEEVTLAAVMVAVVH